PSPTLESSPLDSHISDDVAGMIAIVSFSTLSNIACVSTFAWIYFHRYDYKGTTITPLVLNLLMADFLQSIGFMLSSHWIVIGKIVPGALCSFQGIIINIGDVASGFWALAICVQTFIYVVANLDYSKFAIISMIIIWPCNIFLATAGLFISTPSEPFYNSAGGAWCWISTKYSIYRITFHYGIILCVAALMFVLYAIIYASLFWRRRVLSQTIGRQNAPLGLKNVANKL
ncbi:465_t:CDS:2, partial [Paraglomus occultum]